MANVLIYSPRFDGHRQVYVFVLANVLKELGFNINIAGNTKQIISNSFYIDKLKNNYGFKIIDTSNYTEGGIAITLHEFLKLQDDCKTDLTVFAEADLHISLFSSQLFKRKNKFRGRTVGIIMRPFHFYQKTRLYDKLRYLKHLPSNWRNDEQLFYDFFLNGFSLVDVALCIDENFVAHRHNFIWLPDVFQQYAEKIVKNEKSEQRIWINQLKKFKNRNKDRFLFFYFGTTQYRRGYDILLKLAEESDGCFIHCGLRDNNVKFFYDTNQLRSLLNKDGRLFETDQYIDDPLTIQYFFKSVSHLILPYRNYSGSSGVMLQALDYGIPIMAPEHGIIGQRIKKYGLGITYNGNDESSLYSQFNYFKELDPQKFENKIKIYMNYQTTEQLKAVLINAFIGTDKPVRKP